MIRPIRRFPSSWHFLKPLGSAQRSAVGLRYDLFEGDAGASKERQHIGMLGGIVVIKFDGAPTGQFSKARSYELPSGRPHRRVILAQANGPAVSRRESAYQTKFADAREEHKLTPPIWIGQERGRFINQFKRGGILVLDLDANVWIIERHLTLP
jgi:hypothetical protein